ncbi:MAG: PAS domain S-box protein, partial [Proteobacteria bacterium]
MSTDSALHTLFGDHPYTTLLSEIRDFTVFFMDAQGYIVSWNWGATLLFGYESQDIIGHSFERLFTSEDRQEGAPERELSLACSTGRGEDQRWHLRKDGSCFWGNGSTTALFDERGHLKGFAKIGRDDTARKQIELKQQELTEKLARQHSRFAYIFAHSPAFVTVLQGPNHIYDLANEAYHSL